MVRLSPASPYPLLVSDPLHQKLWRIDGPHQVSLFADADDGLLAPAGLAVDNDGRVYVASRDTNQILRFSPDGSAVEVFADASDGLFVPIGLFLGANQQLYVVNNGFRQVLAFDPTGVGSIVVPGDESVLFHPGGIVGNDNGKLFVGDFRFDDRSLLRGCTLDGACETLIGLGSGLSVPEFPAINSEGVVFLPDFTPGALFQYNPDGTFDRFLDEGQLISPSAVVPIDADTFLVTDCNSGTIFQIDRSGKNRVEIVGATEGVFPGNMIMLPEPGSLELLAMAGICVGGFLAVRRSHPC